ncbi:Prephenate dehydratase-domain-containing protein [Hygrophoropsis aurantiaca]|uniref:Prephenate dehydratase-domain-containing protein n=1 Tax=Hygrophoropsis aurantiaca TaxID=72124 RepID=A0ACB8AF21_9AGAM|nr:Prephenate dehydratase-domain-containing protein [Hygrophoropsis aurantiaca]
MLAASEKPTIAYLGPQGTYSHQAAYDRFGDLVCYEAKQTITDVFSSLSSDLPLALIPYENSIYGAVVETCNLLRYSAAGHQVFIRGDTTLCIQHCLIARPGVKLEDIQYVLSHEQALGQCKAFLEKYLPRATLVTTDSTASAALALLSGYENLDPLKCSAICSQVVLSMWNLSLISKNIQDEHINFTRFYILSWGANIKVPSITHDLPPSHALFRISHLVNPANIPPQPQNLTCLLNALGLRVSQVDRRPSTYSIPFHDVFFIETVREEGILNGKEGSSWGEQVQRAVTRVEKAGGEICVLGTW